MTLVQSVPWVQLVKWGRKVYRGHKVSKVRSDQLALTGQQVHKVSKDRLVQSDYKEILASLECQVRQARSG